MSLARRTLLAQTLGVLAAEPASAEFHQNGWWRRSAAYDPTLSLQFFGPTLDPRITFTRASAATYMDAAGILRTAASNAPRFDCDPTTHAVRGLLIEEQRTNAMLRSADLTLPPWAAFGGGGATPVITGNQSVAPDGTTTAASIAYAAASGSQFLIVYQQPTVTAAVYTFSIWLRGSVGGEQLYLTVASGTGFFYSSPRLTLTTTWQRYSITTPALTAAAWYFQLGTDLRDGTQTATPACTIYAWGGQIEHGAFSTSYIPTTGATVTRALDDCWMPIGAWFNPAAMTLFGEFIYPRDIDSFAAHDLAALGDNTATGNHMVIRATDGGGPPLLAKVNTNLATLAPPGNPVIGAVSKLVGAWSGTTTYACLNGGAVSTQGNATPTGIVRLIFGNINTGGTISPLDGYIRRVQYWPRALSNAELQRVTT